MKNRILSVIIAGLLLMSASACTQKNDPAPNSTAPETTPPATEAASVATDKPAVTTTAPKTTGAKVTDEEAEKPETEAAATKAESKPATKAETTAETAAPSTTTAGMSAAATGKGEIAAAEKPSYTAGDYYASDEGLYYENPAAGADVVNSYDSAFDSYEYEEIAGEYIAEDYCPPWEPYEPYIPEVQARAGLLTGGEVKDNEGWNDWISLFGQREGWTEFSDKWNMSTLSRIAVDVNNGNGTVSGCTVRLKNGDSVIWTAVTDNNGRAYLFDTLKKNKAGKNLTIEAELGSEVVTCDYEGKDTVIEVKGNDLYENSLDLMFLIDTTGSMDDELTYIQAELADVIKRVTNENNTEVSLSVNFYRDEGDEYVLRCNDFTDNINSALRILKEQEANGGGDTPEAVADALEAALQRNWSEDSVKLMFLVLDAPPHDEDAGRMPKLIAKAAEKGIRIIPVVSSGADEDTEFLCRTMAIATGGTYTFLTDDSGIGNSHLEPTGADYTVEKLNDMLVRIIGEYCKKSVNNNAETETAKAFVVKTGDYFEDSSLYGDIIIGSEKELEKFHNIYGKNETIYDFAEQIDFKKQVIAIRTISFGTGSVKCSIGEKGVYVKDGKVCFDYSLEYPELCTDDMACIYVVGAVDKSLLS
ncbi:MAG: VWA domain-containing protein [Ruminiclostridium sp.]